MLPAGPSGAPPFKVEEAASAPEASGARAAIPSPQPALGGDRPAGPRAGEEREEIIIRPPGAFAHLHLAELWRYRGTLWSKAWRRVRLQYDDMLLGLFWAVARPLIMVVIFWALRDLAQAQLGVTIPYPLYVYSGLAIWYFFTEATMAVAMSLQRDAGLIQRVYYPRLLSPLSHLLGETYNLALAAVPFTALALFFGEYPGWRLLLLPAVFLQLLLLTLGVGLTFSSFILKSRDWERVLRFGLYAGLWLSPVIYAVDMIPRRHTVLYLLNPMGGSLMAVRSALFDRMPFPWTAWLYSLAMSVVLAGLGLLLFQRAERNLADRI
jgi:lipopolysaccharide transport system permease protein